jgi:hypothetical protein
MKFRFELGTSCIATSVLYHFATMVYSLVISSDGTRYIHPGQVIGDTLYLLAGVGRLVADWCWSHAAPLLAPAPAMTQISLVQTSTWISRMPILAAQHCLEAAMWRWTVRNRSVGLTGIPAWPIPARRP